MATPSSPPESDRGFATIRKSRIIPLLCAIVALSLGIEATSRVLHDHRRPTIEIEHELNSAFAMHRTPGVTQILLAGNSLIHEGTNAETMQTALGAGYHVQGAGIPGSTYIDWKYGLESLFAEGSRPDLVVFAVKRRGC